MAESKCAKCGEQAKRYIGGLYEQGPVCAICARDLLAKDAETEEASRQAYDDVLDMLAETLPGLLNMVQDAQNNFATDNAVMLELEQRLLLAKEDAAEASAALVEAQGEVDALHHRVDQLVSQHKLDLAELTTAADKFKALRQAAREPTVGK